MVRYQWNLAAVMIGCVCAAAGWVEQATGQCRYEVVVPAKLPYPFFQGDAVAISNTGVVATTGACIWNPLGSNEVVQLPFPPGIDDITITDINDSGTAVGYMSGPAINATHAFKFENGVLTDLGVLPGGIHSAANGINNAGIIVGSCSGSVGPRPCIWRNDSIFTIPTPKDVSAFALDITDTAMVAGQIVLIETVHGFVFAGNNIINLGVVPGGTTSTIDAMNSLGHLAVHGLIPASKQQAFNHAFLWRDEVYGSIENDLSCDDVVVESIIGDMNNQGDFYAGVTPCPPIILQHGHPYGDQPYGLFQLVNYDLFLINSIRRLNDDGVLAGSVILEEDNRIVPAIFVPVPPIPGDFTCDNTVNIDDLTEVILQWGQPHPVIDVDKSGTVDPPDLLEVVLNWSMK